MDFILFGKSDEEEEDEDYRPEDEEEEEEGGDTDGNIEGFFDASHINDATTTTIATTTTKKKRKKKHHASPLISSRTRAKTTIDETVMEQCTDDILQRLEENYESAMQQKAYEDFLNGVVHEQVIPEVLDSESDSDYREDDEQHSHDANAEEYRDDEEVQVSSLELSQLLQDAEVNVDKRPPRRTAAAGGGELGNGHGTINNSSSNNNNNNNNNSAVVAMASSSSTTSSGRIAFTPEQMTQLRRQMKDMFQLSVELYMQALRKKKSSQVSSLHDVLVGIYRHWEVSSAFYTLKRKALQHRHVLPIQLRCIADPQVDAQLSLDANTENLFHVPGIEALPDFLAATHQAQPRLDDAAVSRTLNAVSVGFDAFLKTEIGGRAYGASSASLHDQHNNHHHQSQQSRCRFTPAEDQLLVVGLSRYGLNWALIRKHVLPTKSAAEIANRYKNQSSVSAEDNPIKQFKIARPLIIMSDEEAELLKQQVANVGPNWTLIAQNSFPCRTPEQLQKIWNMLCRRDKGNTLPKIFEREELDNSDDDNG